MKRFIRVSKTSTSSSKALISVVSKLSKALVFSRVKLLIFKRLRDNPVATNYVRPVRTMHFTSLTYTFNSVTYVLTIVNGEILKKTPLILLRCLSNKLALKSHDFSTSIPQVSVKRLVKTEKKDSDALIDCLGLKKTCEVSLQTILCHDEIGKISGTQSSLYQTAFSTESLLIAYDQIKCNPGNLISGQKKETVQGINLK